MAVRARPMPFVTQWILVTVVASLVVALGAHALLYWTALVPARVLSGEIWRLVAWIAVDLTPMSLISSCFAIFWFGGELSETWGDRRLRRFAIEVTVLAGVATCLVAILARRTDTMYSGGLALADALVIAWARQFPSRILVLYGMITLSGRQLINVTIGTAVLFALFYGPLAMAPDLAACAIAVAYPAERLRRS